MLFVSGPSPANNSWPWREEGSKVDGESESDDPGGHREGLRRRADQGRRRKHGKGRLRVFQHGLRLNV